MTSTTYALVVEGLRDLDGDSMESSSTISFSTGDASNIAIDVIHVPNVDLFLAVSDSGIVLALQNSPYAYSLWRDGSTQTLPFMPTAVNNEGTLAGITSVTELYGDKSITSDHAVISRDGVITDLGTLPGHNWSFAKGISRSGDVVGWSGIWDGDFESCCTDSRTVIWQNGTIREIPDFFPTAINGRGEVLGWSAGKPAIWSKDRITALTGGVIDAERPEAGSGFEINDINDVGQVVGAVSNHVFIWKNGVTEVLDNPPGCARALPRDIDNLGRVAGYALCESGPMGERAVVWINKKPILLQGGSIASSIDDLGEIFGRSNETHRAVVWRIKR